MMKLLQKVLFMLLVCFYLHSGSEITESKIIELENGNRLLVIDPGITNHIFSRCDPNVVTALLHTNKAHRDYIMNNYPDQFVLEDFLKKGVSSIKHPFLNKMLARLFLEGMITKDQSLCPLLKNTYTPSSRFGNKYGELQQRENFEDMLLFNISYTTLFKSKFNPVDSFNMKQKKLPFKKSLFNLFFCANYYGLCKNVELNDNEKLKIILDKAAYHITYQSSNYFSNDFSDALCEFATEMLCQNVSLVESDHLKNIIQDLVGNVVKSDMKSMFFTAMITSLPVDKNYYLFLENIANTLIKQYTVNNERIISIVEKIIKIFIENNNKNNHKGYLKEIAHTLMKYGNVD